LTADGRLGPAKMAQPAPSVLQLNSREVIHLINHLAVSFAVTPAVTPLSAFRKVYWCYLFLHRYGAPIQGPITRALWHAGVTRFQETGATLARFKWILTMVREVEGEKVARLLLWSSGFRSRRQDEIEAFMGLEGSLGLPRDVGKMVQHLQRKGKDQAIKDRTKYQVCDSRSNSGHCNGRPIENKRRAAVDSEHLLR